MSFAIRAKGAGRAGSRQSLKLRASHGGGLGLRVSHRQTRDWRPPNKDLLAEAEAEALRRNGQRDRHEGSPAGERKRRRKSKRRKHRR